MPNLEVPAMSSPASLSIVPVKPVPNRAINLFTFNTLNLDSPRVLNRSKDEPGFDSGRVETTGSGGDDEAGEDEAKSLDEHVRDWVRRRVEAGVSEHRCYLLFLSNSPKMVECRVCKNPVYPGEEITCSIRDCPEVYHLACAVESLGLSSSKPFKCPQHTCFICKDKTHLMRCTRCTLASHLKCAPFPDSIIQQSINPGKVVCWRHPNDWRLDLKQTNPATSVEDVFCRLPLPYTEEDFKIDITWKNTVENKSAPPPYVPIKRNIYLIKKRRDDTVIDDTGCTSCWGTECAEDCVCRLQCISCSKFCKCSEKCSNRPFKTEKKISIVQTELCGWGVVAAEAINKRDFIIEYVGEVVDDALCEQRLWKMKHQKLQNFYMCELSKDFTIDATIKGNSSRFLNHSCDPNCKLEKWDVEGERRVGVFAARSIEAGEPLTYDYRFVQFGPEVACHCGASNCQGYLGTKRKISKVDLCQNWGSRRKRTSTARLAIVKVD